MQGVLLDQIGPHPGQVALGQLRQSLVEQVGDCEVEHRIAQEFESFVVIGREAAVRQCTLQQPRVGKGMLEARLQRVKVTARHGRPVEALRMGLRSPSAGRHKGLAATPWASISVRLACVLERQVGRTEQVDLALIGE